MKRQLLTLLHLIVLLFLPVSLYAQEKTSIEALREINKIKMNSNYIWAEGTSTKSKKDALENAQTVLSFELRNWLESSGQADAAGAVMPTSDQYLKIHTQKRNLHRAFVYVEKSKIIPYGKNDKVVVMEKAEEKKDYGTKKKEEQKLVSSVEKIYVPTNLEKEMLLVKTSDDILAFAERDDIAKTGGYRELPSADYYIFIYNREGKVPACLKSTNGRLINIATGLEDSYENYKGCGGQWFIFKK